MGGADRVGDGCRGGRAARDPFRPGRQARVAGRGGRSVVRIPRGRLRRAEGPGRRSLLHCGRSRREPDPAVGGRGTAPGRECPQDAVQRATATPAEASVQRTSVGMPGDAVTVAVTTAAWCYGDVTTGQADWGHGLVHAAGWRSRGGKHLSHVRRCRALNPDDTERRQCARFSGRGLITQRDKARPTLVSQSPVPPCGHRVGPDVLAGPGRLAVTTCPAPAGL